MIQIGIDTSVLIALFDINDKWHRRAVELKRSLDECQAAIAVFDCVLAEAISAMARRMQEQRRSADFAQVVLRLRRAYPREHVLWTLPDVPMLYAEILNMVESSQGELNFHDALIALSCRNRDIPYLASFDTDFDRVPWLTRVSKPADVDTILSA